MIAAVRAPGAWGVNVICSVQRVPAARLSPQSLVCVKSLRPDPESTWNRSCINSCKVVHMQSGRSSVARQVDTLCAGWPAKPKRTDRKLRPYSLITCPFLFFGTAAKFAVWLVLRLLKLELPGLNV